MKNYILLGILALCLLSVPSFGQSSLSNQNSDVTVDDQGVSENGTDTPTDPIILFDLGFPGDPDETDCSVLDWEWRFRGFRLEPEEDWNEQSLFIGFNSGVNIDLTGGNPLRNVYVGCRSGEFSTTGFENVGLGFFSLNANTTGWGNLGLGANSMLNNTTGIRNVALGQFAFASNQAGDNNVAVGVRALENSNAENADHNVAVGYLSLNSSVQGAENVAVGAFALQDYTPATDHNHMTAVGHDAMGSVTTDASACTSIGWESLSQFTDQTMVGTTAVGARALRGFTMDNSNNTGVGAGCGTETTGGDDNTYVGFDSGYDCGQNHRNTFLGSFSGSHVDGSDNVFVGFSSGGIAATTYDGTEPGIQNVFVGSLAGGTTNGSGVMPGDGNVMLGYRAGFQQNVDNELWIDNDANADPLIWGDFTNRRVGINRQNTDEVFEVNGEASKATTGEWLANSDKRLKTNFEALDSEETLQKVLNIQGTTFEWNDNVTSYKDARPEGVQYGFTAQDIQAQFPELVKEDEMGFLMTSYGTFDPMFIESLRALNNKIEVLEKELADLKNPTSSINVEDYPSPGQSVELSNLKSTVLNQNSPNPFAQQTTITFSIPIEVTKAVLVFHNENGGLIQEIEISQRDNGSLVVYGEDLSSGLYTYSLILDGQIFETKRMMKTN